MQKRTYLFHSRRSTNFNNMSNTLSISRQLLSRLTPIRILFVIDNVIRSKLLQRFSLFRTRRRRNNSRTGSLGKLQSKNTNTTRSLRQNSITLLQCPTLKPIKPIPRRERRTSQRSAFQEVEVLRHVDQSLLIVCAVLPQRPINCTSNACSDRV